MIFVLSPDVQRDRKPSHAVMLAILCGALLNGFFKQITGWAVELGSSPGFDLPLGLLDVLIIAIAIGLILSEKEVTFQAKPGWPEAFAAVAILIPSATISWVTAAAYASFYAWRSRGAAAAGCWLLAGFALTQLWTAVFIKWFAVPLGTLDAFLAAAILSLFKTGVFRSANVLGVEHGHSIIILYGCTTAFFLPKLLLVQAAASLYTARVGSPSLFWPKLASILFLGGFANAVRLALMAASAGGYHAIHSPSGGSVFDFLMAVAVLSLTWMGRQR